MVRRFFQPVDPSKLDQYTDRRREGLGRRKPAAVVRALDLFRRSLQSLPYRELQMLFHKQVLRVDQDDIANLFLVRQSNISYRLQRAIERLKLRNEIQSIASETTLRNALLDAGTPYPSVGIVLAVLKTFSQKLTGTGLGLTQGIVRHTFEATFKQIEAYEPRSPQQERDRQALLHMMRLAAANWNRLHEIEAQSRFAWKRGKPARQEPPRQVKYYAGPASPVGSARRRGEFGYTWVQKRTCQDLYQATFTHGGRRVSLYRFSNIHHAAFAVNLANRLVNGPESPDINIIAPEHMPDEPDRAYIEEKVRFYLARRALIGRHG